MLRILLLIALLALPGALASSDKQPHGHQGILGAYDGKPLPMKLSSVQKEKLDKGDAVTYNERDGKSGRGVVIQDVNASMPICMGRIRDLGNYNKMVPHVKKVNIYHTQKFMNGTSKTGAKMDIGLLGMGFGYFLLLTHEPRYNTLTWTLDYTKNSDFDDNVGHWQVQPHPSKKGWTRVLYSCKIKLFPWIPEFVIKFLTTKALTESTGWVKREAELEQSKNGDIAKVPSWFNIKGGASDIRKKLDARLAGVESDLRTQRHRLSSFVKMPKFGSRM